MRLAGGIRLIKYSFSEICYYTTAIIIITSLKFVTVQHYSLKPLDIEFMKQLHHLVNIIPVIAKSDTLTASELKSLKLKVKYISVRISH